MGRDGSRGRVWGACLAAGRHARDPQRSGPEPPVAGLHSRRCAAVPGRCGRRGHGWAGAGGEEAGLGFPEGLEVVAGAVSGVDPSVGDFVRMMAERKWVEGRAGPKKAPGAYCTQFAKSRTPRVYMSAYTGR